MDPRAMSFFWKLYIINRLRMLRRMNRSKQKSVGGQAFRDYAINYIKKGREEN